MYLWLWKGQSKVSKCTAALETKPIQTKPTVVILGFPIRRFVGNIFFCLFSVSFPSAASERRAAEKKAQGAETIQRPLVHFSAALMSAVILSIFLLLPSPVAAAGKSFEKRRGLKGAASSWEGGCSWSRLRSGLRLLSIFASSLSSARELLDLRFGASQINLWYTTHERRASYLNNWAGG